MKGFLCACLIIAGMSVCAAQARKSDASADFSSLVEAERSFARTAGEKGMKDAFIAFADDDGIIFRRAPINAKESWRAKNPAPTGLLSWQPIYADVSRAGDLGYTIGPYEFRVHPTDKKPADQGQFMTIWRRQPDGSWKFALDLGISHAAPPVSPFTRAPVVVQSPATSKIFKGSEKSDPDITVSNASLFDAEMKLAQAYSKMSTAQAFLSNADDDVRLNRPNNFPFVGKNAARVFLESHPAMISWHTTKAEAAFSGDLGYAYGTYESRAKSTDVKPFEQGNYLRVWKREQPGGKWRVVLEVTNVVSPLPPAP